MPITFDPELESSSDHDTRIWMYTENKYCKLEISPFYSKNTWKMCVKGKRVKSITKRPNNI